MDELVKALDHHKAIELLHLDLSAQGFQRVELAVNGRQLVVAGDAPTTKEALAMALRHLEEAQ